MPVRAKVTTWLTEQVVGGQVWNGLIGECQTMPTRAWEEAAEAADIGYERIIIQVDWQRIMIEATSRHLALDHPEDSMTGNVCGDCVREALLEDDRWPPDRQPAPRRNDGRDWFGVLAKAREKWKR